MNGTGDHHVNQNKPGSEGQRSHVFPHMWMLGLQDKGIPKCIHDLACMCVCGERERDDVIVLVGLSDGTTEKWERKRNMVESE
jgi:hypothetical protein